MLQISSKCKSNDKNNCQKFIIVNEKNVTMLRIYCYQSVSKNRNYNDNGK